MTEQPSILAKIIDYSEFITKSTQGFVGRQWVRDEVDKFLQDAGPRYFLLLGEPGSGKTAFMAQLVRERGYLHHFVGKGSRADLTSSSDWRDPIVFAASVGYQLVQKYGDWVMQWEEWGIHVSQTVKQLDGILAGAEIKHFQAVPRPADLPILTVEQEVEEFGTAAQAIGVYVDKFEASPELIVRQLLFNPLKAVAERERQVVVVIDGLDESLNSSDPQKNIMAFLPDAGLPSNIRFLLTSQPGKHLTNEFQGRVQPFWISEDPQGQLNPNALADAHDFIVSLLTEPSVKALLDSHRPPVPAETLSNRVADASAGNFLYLHHYAEGLRAGDKTLFDLNALPQGLYGIYGDFLDKIARETSDSVWLESYKPILGTLAIAKESLTRQQVADFSGVGEERAGTILNRLTQFLEITGQGRDRRYRIYHTSFSDYLISEENADHIDQARAHKRIVNYYWQRCEGDWTKLVKEDYLCRHLAEHMLGAGDRQSLYTLINAPWMEAKFSTTFSHRSFVQDLHCAIQAARTEDPPNLSQLVRNCLVSASLSSLTSSALPEVVGLLAQCGQAEKARGIAALMQDETRKSKAYCQIANALLTKHEAAEARTMVQQALTAAQRISVPESVAQMLGEVAVLAAQVGDPRWAKQIADQARAVVSKISDEKVRTIAISELATSLARLGDFDLARQAIETALAEAQAWKLFIIQNSIRVLDKTRQRAKDALVHGAGNDRWSSALPKAQTLLRAAQVMAHLGEETRALEIVNQARDETRRILYAEERALVLAEASILLAERGEALQVRQLFDTVGKLLTNSPDCNDSFLINLMNPEGFIEEWRSGCYGGKVTLVGLVSARLAEALTRIGWKQEALSFAKQQLQVTEGIPDAAQKAETLGWVAVALAHAGETALGQQVASRTLDLVAQQNLSQQRLRLQIATAQALGDMDDNMHTKLVATHAITTAFALAPQDVQARSQAIEAVLTLLAGLKDSDTIETVLKLMREKQDAIENSLWTVIALWLQRNFGQIPDAIDNAVRLIEGTADPNVRLGKLIGLTGILVPANQSERARSILERALVIAQEIGRPVDKAQALCNLAEIMVQLGMKENAARIAAQVYELAKTIPEPRSKANVLLSAAWALAQAGEFGQAEEAARAIVPLEPRDPFTAQFGAVGPMTLRALVTVGQAMARAHEFERTLSLTEQELGDWENDTAREDVLNTVVAEMAREHQWTRARQVAGRIGNPDRRSRALVNLAVAQARAQEWDTARSLAEEIEVPLAKINALVQIASLLASSGRWEEALNVTKAIADQSWKAKAWNNLALALARAGHLPQAIEIARDTVELARACSDAYDAATVLCRAAQVFVQVGEMSEARTVLAEAFDTGRRGGRESILHVFLSAVQPLAKLDRGETLWNVYSAMMDVETWWNPR